MLETEGFPRWDTLVEAIAGQLQLTPAMIERCDQSLAYDTLHVQLLSLTDIFVFRKGGTDHRRPRWTAQHTPADRID